MTKITKPCKFCKKEFESYISANRSFCGPDCAKKQRKLAGLTAICLTCGDSFPATKYQIEHGGAKYCSKKCYLVVHSEAVTITRKCLGCDKEFSFPKHMDKTCCSLSCNTKWKKRKNKDKKYNQTRCLFCKKEMEVLKTRAKGDRGKFCSRVCYASWMSVFRIEENCPNWKGGITPFYRSLRTCSTYRKWRLSILDRDNHTCQDCGKKDCLFEVDHIKPLVQIVSENNLENLKQAYGCDELWNTSNGITLCKPCHHKRSASQRQLVVDFARGIVDL